jgi:hypothetical protein
VEILYPLGLEIRKETPMQRGRKSSAARAVANVMALQGLDGWNEGRPKAPRELTKDQREEWDEITARMPQDWFGREMFPMLVSLCRAVSYSRRLAAELEEVEHGLDSLPDRLRQQNPETTLKDIEAILQLRLNRRTDLYRLQADQARLVMALSTKLRLTPQSRYQPATAGRKTFDQNQQPRRFPWEDDDDD